ncbi:MAG: hypothetical protein R2879_20150 [Saprospiraceae bacterium]
MAIMLFALLLPFSAGAQLKANYAQQAEFLPNYLFRPLTDCEDFTFQNALLQKINENPKLRNLARQEKLAVGLVDLSNPYDVKYGQINGEVMMYAASLPKIAVLLAAEDALDKGELKPTKDVLSDMRLMIAKSNNQATTRMIDRLGYKKIASVLKDPNYNLYNEDRGGGLWVGKDMHPPVLVSRTP